MALPSSTKALIIERSSQPKTPVYHDIRLERRPIPKLLANEVLVQMTAVGFNHRELWMRKGLYPGIGFGNVLGADGAGIIIASQTPNDPLLNKRVFLVPMRGWESSPLSSETTFGILGGGTYPPIGTFAEYVVIDRRQVIEIPPHLDDEHAAAWPIGGVTAWRAITYHARLAKGQNVLITGIGGGVALIALQMCVALGVNVYVTSGDQTKLDKAIQLGAKAGVNYKSEKWPQELGVFLSKDGQSELDAVIDSSGGDIPGKTTKLLKDGGRIVLYGMTADLTTKYTMLQVLKNIELHGTRLGSHRDLREATAFMAEHKIAPIISHVLDGLENAEEGFNILARGTHFGKVVIQIRPRAKL